MPVVFSWNKNIVFFDRYFLDHHRICLFYEKNVFFSFYIFPTTAIEIENEILKNDKANAGSFSILVSILKIIKRVIARRLEILLNTSISTGIVPSSFKLARVFPVFKKGSHINLNNYRYISLLFIFNKRLEKLMCNRLIGHSTDYAIPSIVDKIQKAIDEREHSCMWHLPGFQ